MKKYLYLFFFLFLSTKSSALIEVDITRGNLNPLPIAVSPLAIDENSRKEFEKILEKKKYRFRNFIGCRKKFKNIRTLQSTK